MIITKHGKHYSFDISPKTVIDDDEISIKIGKGTEKLNKAEVATLICLLTTLLKSNEIKKCGKCGTIYTKGKYCSECGNKLL